MSWNREKVDICKKIIFTNINFFLCFKKFFDIQVLFESGERKSQEKAELKYCRVTMFAGSLRLLVANMLCLLTHIQYLSA